MGLFFVIRVISVCHHVLGCCVLAQRGSAYLRCVDRGGIRIKLLIRMRFAVQ